LYSLGLERFGLVSVSASCVSFTTLVYTHILLERKPPSIQLDAFRTTAQVDYRVHCISPIHYSLKLSFKRCI